MKLEISLTLTKWFGCCSSRISFVVEIDRILQGFLFNFDAFYSLKLLVFKLLCEYDYLIALPFRTISIIYIPTCLNKV